MMGKDSFSSVLLGEVLRARLGSRSRTCVSMVFFWFVEKKGVSGAWIQGSASYIIGVCGVLHMLDSGKGGFCMDLASSLSIVSFVSVFCYVVVANRKEMRAPLRCRGDLALRLRRAALVRAYPVMFARSVRWVQRMWCVD
jgi:hypothetical protein